MLRNGDIEKVRDIDIGVLFDGEDAEQFIWKRTESPGIYFKGKQDCLVSTVWAKSKDAAVKIVDERRVRMIASGEWI